MSQQKKYRIADVDFEMHYESDYLKQLCTDYEIDPQLTPEFVIQVSENDMEAERQKSEEKVPEYIYESLAVYRKLCEEMIDHDCFLFHCSAVAVDGKAYLFAAPSGTGKSTHTRMWRQYFGTRAVMINDDKPLIQVKENVIYVCGTPWCGKHGIQTNQKMPIQGICILRRGAENTIRRLTPIEGYPELYRQTYRPTEKREKMLKTLALLKQVTERIPLYEMHCNISDYLIGTIDPGHGTANISIDNGAVTDSINTQGSSRKTGQIIYTTPDLADGEHTLTLTTTGTIGVDGAYVINNADYGMIGIENASYTMKEDSEMEVKLVRVGGTKEATVTLTPNPGSAVQGDFDTSLIETVTFEEGETEKTATVRTKRNPKQTGDLNFTIELSSAQEELILGFNRTATVTIKDSDSRSDEYTAEDPFVFPSNSNEEKVLEAEHMVLNNTGTNETWKLEVANGTGWASNGKFVNCWNNNDTLKLYYNAPEAGIYRAKVTYRSGNVKNSFHWSEASGKVEAGAAVMGASSSGETNTGEILLRVLEAGEGVITFTAGSANTQLNDGPQFDKLDICKTELEVFGDQNSETLKSNASANSWHAGNQGATGDGVAAWAFDGKTNTWWHSNYSTTTSANINGAASASNAVWIQTGFNKSWSVKEIFYRARTDKANENAMMNYKVYIANLEDPSATPTDTDFGYPENPVAAGSLNGNIIDLGEFHDATHVRIAAVSSSNTNGFITATKIDFLGKEVEAPTPVEYTVTFDRQNGEEVTTQTVAENTELTLSETETPVREGYVFTGWYTDAECTEACEDTITVTADLTIYAGWTADKTALESAIAAAETVERENYTEESWNRFTAALEKAQEVKQDTAATAEAVSSAAEELTEAMGQLEVVTTFTVAATAENGTVTVNVPEGKTANALDAYDEVTVTAEAAEGYEFVYWMDKDTKVVLSENAEYTFVVVKNTNLEAVFAEKESEAVVVTFMTGDEFANQFVAAVTAEDGTVQLPEAKEYAGYEFAGWDTNGDGIAEIASDETTANVTESATWIAVYTAKETYTVTVTNGEIISGKQEDGSYELGSKLGVKAVKPEGTEGTFSGWYAGETLVSTNETYWFVVNAETELEARWSEAAVVAAEPVVRFSKTNRTTEASGKQKVEIALSWSAPKEGCTVLAEGILRTYKTGLEDQLTLGTTVSGITTNQCKSVGQNGTFTLTVNLGATSANRTKDITVRGYVRYMDASGEIHVAYTEPTVIAVPK